MLSRELLEQVNTLDDDDKLKLVHVLMDDLALGERGYDIFGFRGNYQVADALMKKLEKDKEPAQSQGAHFRLLAHQAQSFKKRQLCTGEPVARPNLKT